MQHKKISFAETKAFSPFFLDYINQKETLKPFYHRFPDIQNFKEQIEEKYASFPDKNRQILVSTLENQYQHVPVHEAVTKNISSLLNSKTFTVTTGHQLNIFTGPLYFIYKIVTVITTCKQLKEKYPGFNFVPVYWMASEDHDYDEIKYFNLYGKKYVWETLQKGAVGRFHTKGFDSLIDLIPGDTAIFKEAYLKNKKLSDAVRHYVNALFGKEGLIILDPDEPNLKSAFQTVIKEDVLEQVTSKLVETTNKSLEGLGYKPQIFCRDINFFYLEDNIRSRITKQGDLYGVLETSLTFSKTEIQNLIEKEPQKFSPNVILRPLYQEMILPNLAYVGGPAEIVYWLQLKIVFDHFLIPFPILVPRNFGMVVDHTLLRKFEKTGLNFIQLFEDKNYLFKHWILKNSSHNLSVETERTTILEIYNQLKKRAVSIDKTLGPFADAEGLKVMKSLERIERKLMRAEKRIHGDRLRQIETIKNALFPHGNLQERVDNFLNFYQQDKEFINKLINQFNPFDFQFYILMNT